MDAGDSGRVLKRVVLQRQSGERFRLIARGEGAGVCIVADNVPASLDPALQGLLDRLTSASLPNESIQDDWRALLESFQAGGWTSHEEFMFTVEMSENDGMVVSRLTSPDAPSGPVVELYQSLHARMTGMLPDTARRFASDILRLTAAGQHVEAFAALKRAEAEGTFIGPPSRELLDAICSINRAVLPRSDAFHLWGRRLNEKSRGRFYDDIEEDLRLLEQDYAEELAAIEGVANVNLLIRAEAAEYTNRHENAYARYRELAARTPLDAKLRAHANWGLFRLSPPDSTTAGNFSIRGEA